MKIALTLIVTLILIVLVAGMVVPREFNVERDVFIKRPRSEVFAAVRSLRQHDRWNPWIKKDPATVIDYKGADNIVGSLSTWSGNDEVGAGEREITAIRDDERIDVEVRISRPMETINHSYIITEAVSENETRVKWGLTSQMRFPMNIVCLVMDLKGKLAVDFDEGLSMLKADLEQTK